MGETGWREMERNREVLERILMLLLALAGLADRASSLPARDRPHLLGIIACAEAEARSFLIGMTHRSAAPAHVAPLAPIDDGCLAAGLRALALLLGAMLAEARGFSREPARAAGAPVPALKPVRPQAFPAPRAPDTS